ncbi:SGNH/GDSL hydrolase family protein [Streptomyces sp. NPDC001941]|uniref:SGNH/GDSL hydrolase family protein n=1 Tax=Streptomyces sp. NPDC001941 TaxID=3154659 RepID=UPI0033195257
MPIRLSPRRARTARRALCASLAALCALLAAPSPALAGDAPRDYDEYVALGDSWSADVALLTNVSSEHVPYACFQSTWNYPKKVAQELGVATFRDATCGSATTKELAQPQDIDYAGLVRGVNAPQFDRLTPTTDLVTVGIGGNDAGLASILRGCFNLLPEPLGRPCRTHWVQGGKDTMSQQIEAVEDKVYEALLRTHQLAPNATVLAVDYLAGAPTDRGCFPFVQILDDDLVWLGGKLKELNAVLARAVTRAREDADGFDVRLVDTYSGSVGHDICKLPGTKWVEGFVPVTTNPPGLAVPFHPNELGAAHQAAAVLGALGR